MAASFLVTQQVGTRWVNNSYNRTTRALAASEDEEFEARLARLTRKVGRPGKKAEIRKSKKSDTLNKKVLLPPIPLKDPVSEGLVVELGFNSYTERLNGRFASLGLVAVILVELASGESFLKYHEPAVIGIQVYTMLALAALFIKFEREKISLWPPPGTKQNDKNEEDDKSTAAPLQSS